MDKQTKTKIIKKEVIKASTKGRSPLTPTKDGPNYPSRASQGLYRSGPWSDSLGTANVKIDGKGGSGIVEGVKSALSNVGKLAGNVAKGVANKAKEVLNKKVTKVAPPGAAYQWNQEKQSWEAKPQFEHIFSSPVKSGGVRIVNPNPVRVKKQGNFVPTKEAGITTPELKTKLQKEAPETLVAPSRKGFNSQAAYEEAVRKFKKFGNWASDK